MGEQSLKRVPVGGRQSGSFVNHAVRLKHRRSRRIIPSVVDEMETVTSNVTLR